MRPGPTGMGIATGTRPPQPARLLTLEVGQRHHLAGGGAGRGRARAVALPRASLAVTLGKAFSPHVILQIINDLAASPSGRGGCGGQASLQGDI